jgi:hypothetical protein
MRSYGLFLLFCFNKKYQNIIQVDTEMGQLYTNPIGYEAEALFCSPSKIEMDTWIPKLMKFRNRVGTIRHSSTPLPCLITSPYNRNVEMHGCQINQ